MSKPIDVGGASFAYYASQDYLHVFVRTQSSEITRLPWSHVAQIGVLVACPLETTDFQ